MKYTMEDAPDLTLPDDSIHRARLQEIKPRSFEWTDKENQKREGNVLDWWWEITSTNVGPQYVGRNVKGTCDARLTNHSKNQFHAWASALLGREITVGMAVDTDDLVGLEAEIVVQHQKNKKDPTKVYEVVTDVVPLSGAYDTDPPF